MSILFKVYSKAPLYFQNLMCSLKGWIIYKRRYNSKFKNELSRYLMNDSSVKEFQKFLLESSSVKAYKGILSDCDIKGLTNGTVNIDDLLQKFPIINKQIVKADIESYINKKYLSKCFLIHTSGTTGSGISFPYTYDMENKQWAIWWRYRIRLGLNMNMWCGWFGGRIIMSNEIKTPPFWRINYPCKQVMYSSYHLSKDSVSLYVEDILKRNIEWLHGYPSSITRFANLINELGISPLSNVKYITTGAENLYESQRTIMKKAFPKAIVRQHYGLTEGVANISQDYSGEWYIDDDFCHVEFIPLDPSNPSICRIIGTGYSNLAFPLIRYDTGDIAEVYFQDGKCKVKSIDGRKEDYITLPNGTKLGRLDHIFKDCLNINEAQIHQISEKYIIFNIVKGSIYSKNDERLLLKNIRERIPQEVKIDITYLDKIPRTHSGKLRLVISNI